MAALDFAKAVQTAKSFIEVGRVHAQGPEYSIENLQMPTGRELLRHEPLELLALSQVDPFYFDALKLSVASFLDEGIDLAPEIRDWLARFLRGEVASVMQKSGPPYKVEIHVLIGRTIQMLLDEGMTATRGDESDHRDSACDVVAEALTELGLTPATFPSVKKIWLQYKKAAQSVPL